MEFMVYCGIPHQKSIRTDKVYVGISLVPGRSHFDGNFLEFSEIYGFLRKPYHFLVKYQLFSFNPNISLKSESGEPRVENIHDRYDI